MRRPVWNFRVLAAVALLLYFYMQLISAGAVVVIFGVLITLVWATRGRDVP